ncbi:MAG: FAD:protein FMN transferase [Nitrospiria bacterium]
MYYRQVLVLIISLVFSGLMGPPSSAAAEKKGHLVSEERALMGTRVVIKAFGYDQNRIDQAIRAGFSEVVRLEKMMSNYIPTSELSRINQNAGKAPVPVSRELFNLIRKAVDYSKLTEGAFDLSFASVGKLWSFRKEIVPSPKAVQERIHLVDYKKIRLEEKTSSIFLTHRGMEIGPGGIGKGYAMDRTMAVLKDYGINNAMVMAGGDTLIRGKKGNKAWQVGLRDPNKQHGILAVLPLEDQAISTSGDYERFFMKDGVRYHHILDTRTGFPAMLCRSVTILAPDATTSDALSTSVFVLGPEKGLALIEGLDKVEAIIIDPQGRIHLSSGLTASDLNTSNKKEE